MGAKFRTIATISDSFREILKRQRYEELVLTIMNRSQSLIGNLPLSRVTEQSNGEPDYMDTKGNKYDVKLLLDSNQGALIGERKNDLQLWFKSMIDECEEYNGCIKNRDIMNIQNTQLYGILKNRLSSVKSDEIAIMFCPYPIVDDYQHSVFTQFATDFLQAVINELEVEINACQEVYFLCPSMEKGIMVLREANTRIREYIDAPEIDEYISYYTVPIVE